MRKVPAGGCIDSDTAIHSDMGMSTRRPRASIAHVFLLPHELAGAFSLPLAPGGFAFLTYFCAKESFWHRCILNPKTKTI